MKIKLDKEKGAYMPCRAHRADAGMDLRTPHDLYINGQSSMTVDTGVHLEIPFGWVGLVKSKSGLMCRHDIVTDGTIDSGYIGSIAVKLFNHGHQPMIFQKGDKIAQIVIVPCYLDDDLEVVDELEETERGSNGFGSTGR